MRGYLQRVTGPVYATLAVSCAVLFVLACLGVTRAATAPVLQTYTATWTAPLKEVDGSALPGPVTYQVYVGTVSQSIKLSYGPTVSTLSEMIVPAVPGLMCVTLTAISGGVESAPSNEACVTVPGSNPVTSAKPTPPVLISLK